MVGSKKAAILAEDLYEDLELWYPLYRLREAGVEVRVVGPRAEVVHTSKHGYPVKTDLSAENVAGRDFDVVIIPGGYSPDRMRRSPAMVGLVKDAFAAGRLVAAICHGGWMLVSAGVLRGKRVTGFFSIADDLQNAGAQYVDQPAVVDGNLITSRTPEDLPAFMQAILKALDGA